MEFVKLKSPVVIIIIIIIISYKYGRTFPVIHVIS